MHLSSRPGFSMRSFIIVAALAFAAAAGVYFSAIAPSDNTGTPPPAPPPGPIALLGEIVCLPHRGDGPMTEECAHGLRGDDGKNYGLRYIDGRSFVSGEISVGTRVSVSGTFAPAGPDERYDVIGYIAVADVRVFLGTLRLTAPLAHAVMRAGETRRIAWAMTAIPSGAAASLYVSKSEQFCGPLGMESHSPFGRMARAFIPPAYAGPAGPYDAYFGREARYRIASDIALSRGYYEWAVPADFPLSNDYTFCIEQAAEPFLWGSVNPIAIVASGSIPIQAWYPEKIVYATDQSVDVEALRQDCRVRKGAFNECGSVCSRDAAVCVEMCAFTCEFE